MKQASYKNTLFFILIFFLLASAFFYFGTYRNWPYKIEADGKYYYQYLVSAAYDQDIDFTNNYRAEKYPWMVMEVDHYQLRKELDPNTHKPVNYWTTGPAFLWLPFFALAILVGKVLSSFGQVTDMNPFGLYMQYFTMFSAVIYTTAALYLTHRINTRFHTLSSSRLSIWLFLFMTPLFYYTVFEPSLSHVYDFFTFILVVYLCLEQRKNRGYLVYLALGFACALHVLVRTQNIVNVFILICFMLPGTLRQEGLNRKLALRFAIFLGALTIGLLPILAVNTYLYGSPLTIPQGEGFMRWSDPQIIPLLFSDRNGFFSFHPIYLLGVVGFAISLSKKTYDNMAIFIALALIFLAQVYINSVVEDWWAGHSFGQRRLLFCLPLFIFGMSYLLDSIRNRFARIYKFFIPVFVFSGTTLWFYLTMIHVFIWDYNQPNNIYQWMFHYAPTILNEYYRIF